MEEILWSLKAGDGVLVQVRLQIHLLDYAEVLQKLLFYAELLRFLGIDHRQLRNTLNF
jgi:hypothetical protein